MTVTYKNCSAGDSLIATPPTFYRFTLVPAINGALGVDDNYFTDDTWAAEALGVPDMFNTTPFIAAQGAPTVISDPTAGRVMVIDTLPRESARGSSLALGVASVNQMSWLLSVASVESLGAGNSAAAAGNPSVTPQNQLPTQAVDAQKVGAAVQAAASAPVTAVTSAVSSVGTYVLVGLALVAGIVVISQLKRA